MLLFRYADDYYGHWLPMQILLPAVVLANFLVVLFMGVHLLRRSRGAPLCQRAASADAFGDHPIRKFEIGARLYHWGNFAFLALLAISGFALLVPGSMKPIVLSWLRTTNGLPRHSPRVLSSISSLRHGMADGRACGLMVRTGSI